MKKKQTIPRQTIIDADYADDLALFVNTPVQTESLLQSLEQTVGVIGLYVIANDNLYV